VVSPGEHVHGLEAVEAEPEEVEELEVPRGSKGHLKAIEFTGSLCYDGNSEELIAQETIAMEKEIIFAVEESPEGGYVAKALGFSIYTEADTFEDLKKMVHESVLCHFEDKERPKIIRLHLVKEELLAV
jgi:hypothetical protein